MKIDPPPDYEDVNQVAIKDWKAETTTRERIRAVVQRIQDPTSAAAIAAQAHASEPVARDALADLVDLGVVETLETTQGTLYKRNDQMYIYQQVVKLHEAYDENELVTELQTLKQTVNTWRDKHNVESPTELAQQLEPDDTEGWEDHTAWQTAEQNLYLTKVAISFYDASKVLV